MMKTKWAKVTAIFLLAYGIFLWVQTIWDIWPTEESHIIAKVIGGVILICWSIIYLKIKRG